jgi:sterol desaturase/sphingolipid hydroxylase (fatty acid hydroxylase superfamily)
MSRSRPEFHEAAGLPSRVVKYALQPGALLVGVGYWSLDPANPLAYVIVIGTLQLVLTVLERVMPARPDWVVSGWTMLLYALLVVALMTFAINIGQIYETALRGALASGNDALLGDLWPRHWPILAQATLAFFLGEAILYWIHRAEHRWPVVWRLSGHGAHHSFKQLGAVNFGLNHPLDLLLIVLPSVLIGLAFGVGEAATGAAIIASTQASIAHANLDLNTRVIGWVLTTNRYHIHHHSVVLEESNTNYGCSTIIWDRLFGTFRDAATLEAGSGPTEPTLWQKTLMPLWEPPDTAIAPD